MLAQDKALLRQAIIESYYQHHKHNGIELYPSPDALRKHVLANDTLSLLHAVFPGNTMIPQVNQPA